MKKHYKTIDQVGLEIGQRFGRWTIISNNLVQHSGRKQVQVKCDCGNYGIVRHDRLKQGLTTSCKSCQQRSYYPETRKSSALHYKGLKHNYLTRLKTNII